MNTKNFSRRKITLIVAFVALVIGGLIFWRLTRDPFQASSEPLRAEFSAYIIRDDQPLSGTLVINGDCPEGESTGTNGAFFCDLTTEDPLATKLNLNSLSFYEADTESVIDIPLLTESLAIEAQPLQLSSGEKLDLVIKISADGKVTSERWKEDLHEYTSFPEPEN